MPAQTFAEAVIAKAAGQLRQPTGKWKHGKAIPLRDLTDVEARPVSASRMAESVARFEAGETPPPIDIMQDADGSRALIDGHHRLAAGRALGIEAMPVRLHRSTHTFGKMAEPGAGDVSVPTALGNRKPVDDEENGKPLSVSADIAKVDDEQRMVWGWASVATVNGKPVVDFQGDVIDVADLQTAAHEFMKSCRIGGEMHKRMGVGEVVESLVVTKALAQAMGWPTEREGWLVGVKVHDDAVWQRVKAGELAAFSIGGQGVRTPIEGAAS